MTVRLVVRNDGPEDLVTPGTAIRAGWVEVAGTAAPVVSTRYTFAGWALDTMTRELRDTGGRRVHLTSSEFDLLSVLLRQAGRPLSRVELTQALRGRSWSYYDRAIDTLVARLRRKLSGEPALIRSVRGVGYVFCAAVRRYQD